MVGMQAHDTCLTPVYRTPDAGGGGVPPCGYEFVWKKPLDYMKCFTTVIVPSFDLLHDSQRRNHNNGVVQATSKGVSVWSLQGRQELSNQTYMNLITDMVKSETVSSSGDPQNSSPLQSPPGMVVVSLYDQAAPHQSKRRHEQAHERTQMWLQELMQHTESYSIDVWSVVPSNYGPMDDDGAKSMMLDYIEHGKHFVSGHAIVGSYHDSGGESLLPIEKIAKLVNSTSPKTAVMLSVGSIQGIIKCFEQGVLVIGTNLPTKLSQLHKALVFPLNYKKKKKRKLDNNDTSIETVVLDLSDPKYARDKSRLLEHCCCMTCTQDYSRAYLHHLYQAKELLAHILLMGHNLHHMLELCRVASLAKEQNELEDFIQHCNACI